MNHAKKYISEIPFFEEEEAYYLGVYFGWKKYCTKQYPSEILFYEEYAYNGGAYVDETYDGIFQGGLFRLTDYSIFTYAELPATNYAKLSYKNTHLFPILKLAAFRIKRDRLLMMSHSTLLNGAMCKINSQRK